MTGPPKRCCALVFAQQYEKQGDWPQWFMLEPYSAIQDKEAHGDVIVWPLKALCDYIEATGDFAFLDEPIAWRREDNFEKTPRRDPVEIHIAKLIATVRERFVPGTHLLRYGNGDWNDLLQPVDPALRDWMVSSWTVALLYQQLRRYAAILRLTGRADPAEGHDSLAAAMKKDFNRFLIRDGMVAGYGVFRPEGGAPKLLLHPSDERTGLSFSLIPMTQAIIGGALHAEPRRGATSPSFASISCFPTAHGSWTGRLPITAESRRYFDGPNRPPSSAAKLGSCTSTRISATPKP